MQPDDCPEEKVPWDPFNPDGLDDIGEVGILILLFIFVLIFLFRHRGCQARLLAGCGAVQRGGFTPAVSQGVPGGTSWCGGLQDQFSALWQLPPSGGGR